jgi:hypothetical protein
MQQISSSEAKTYSSINAPHVIETEVSLSLGPVLTQREYLPTALVVGILQDKFLMCTEVFKTSHWLLF